MMHDGDVSEKVAYPAYKISEEEEQDSTTHRAEGHQGSSGFD